MNRNVNMTGNFSNTNGKGLKPGDFALINKKNDPFGNKTSTNTNFNKMGGNMGGNMGGMNNMGNSKYQNFDPNEVNEAKDHLKLLKMKMGGGLGGLGGAGGGVSNTIGYGGASLNNMSNTGNYRKPFKPSFGNEENNNIQMDTNKKISSTGKFGQNTQLNYGNSKKNLALNNKPSGMKTNTNRRQQVNYEEVEDNRPIGGGNFNPDEIEEPEDGNDEDRIECKTCGRKFKEEALEKHAKVCKKVFASKRKAFDMKKQRIIDNDHAMILKYKEVEEKKKGKLGQGQNNKMNNNSKKQKWKKQSEEFRAILKNNRDVEPPTFGKGGNVKGGGKMGNTGGYGKSAGGMGGSSYANIPSAITDDYTHCNMCNRKYNEQAYMKHLPTCERRTKEAMMKNKLKPSGGNNINTNGTYSYSNKPNLNVKFGKK